MITKDTLQFLKTLKQNNNKAWFDTHRADYEQAKSNFIAFVQEVIDKHSKKDHSIQFVTAKECIFRINKDIRFSKDKTPYKTNFGASINAGGRKNWNNAGYYFHLEPENSFMGGGIYMPQAPALTLLRKKIETKYKTFDAIIKSKSFQSTFGKLSTEDGMALSRLPKGYKPDHPAAEYLKFKSFVASVSISDKDICSADVVKHTLKAFEAIQPLIEFVNK